MSKGSIAKLKDSMAQIDNFYQSATGRAQHRRDMKDAESVPVVAYARGPEGRAIAEAYIREHRSEQAATPQAAATDKQAQSRAAWGDVEKMGRDARALASAKAVDVARPQAKQGQGF